MTDAKAIKHNNVANITLTISQQRVLNQILEFIQHPTDRVFILKGYAGTGKTTLMRYIINELKEQEKNYRLLASTGRAAKILSNLSGDDNKQASTIHSLVYKFNGLNKEYDDKEEVKVDSKGQLFLMFEPSKLDKGSPETVYMIDEASMVSDRETKLITQAQFGSGRLLKELLDYDNRPKSKFIFVGDPCQLPPIREYYSPALIPEYFKEKFDIHAQEAQLTEIMRQDGVSGIVDASKKIRGLYNNAPADKIGYGTQRAWGFLPFANNKDILLHPNIDDLTDAYVEKVKKDGLNSAICICRENRVCAQLSAKIRASLGFSSYGVQQGDLLMVVQNNMETGLMNGDMVIVESISTQFTRRAMLTFRSVTVRELFTDKTYTCLLIDELLNQAAVNLNGEQQKELFIDFILRMRDKGIDQKKKKKAFYDAMQKDPYLNALRCVYGYAVTCHKSQGGEWNDVFVHVPRNITLNPTKETYQWIYTAMTRAKKTLHMVKDFYIR